MREPGDFTTDRRLLPIGALAVVAGVAGAFAAMVLFHLIALFTNLCYLHRLSFADATPGAAHPGPWGVLVPVAGGLVIGLMARYGSDRIRGHGIPEAMEAILIGRSRMQPKVAVLKPLSSAISIGSGGPFGAEGPIIMTGGAVGSIIAQAFHLTSVERKTLLVAGAAAGMSATFAAPLAAVLLAVELLLFEWKPRSLIPVAIAASVAALLRPYLVAAGPLFPVTPHASLPAAALGSALIVGLVVGAASILLTLAVYAAEDGFQRLPLHWMWWPAIGGLASGLGGLVEPRALGVGFDVIRDLLAGHYVVVALAGLAAVKAAIWAVSLGSGTSGGVLAPLLMIGGAIGGLLSGVLPGGDPSLFPLLGMAAALGGAMRLPLTAVVFAVELTRDVATLPALLIASVAADALTVLVLRRSILTEKVARRGHHVSREYTVDPLELVRVGEVMTRDVQSLPAALPLRDLVGRAWLGGGRKHHGYPVVDDGGAPLGVITRDGAMASWLELEGADAAAIVYDLVEREPIVIDAGASCRSAAERMAESGVGRLLVIERDRPGRLAGIITRSDLLRARARRLDEERRRERFFGPSPAAAPPADSLH